MAPTAGNRRVVVGVDASPGSLRALRWAASEAEILDATIDVVHAWTVPVVVYPEGEIFETEPFRHEAQHVLDDAMAALESPDVPSIEARPRLVEMAPVDALVTVAAGAELLVLGTRGLGAFADVLVRSISQGCVERAPCPVVVVPAVVADGGRSGRVVVGVDGSHTSADALQWALAEAARRRADLGVVIAYHHHQLESLIGLPGAVDHDSVRKASQALADEMVERAITEAAQQPVSVEIIALASSARHALVDAAVDADLLVVGSRGRSNLRGVLLGSVSRHCVHHARCPVVIVRGYDAVAHENESGGAGR
jgi:nucleotide-binding universal stress UspA family protein